MAIFGEIVSWGCRHFRMKTAYAYSFSHFEVAIDDNELSIDAHLLETVGFEIFCFINQH